MSYIQHETVIHKNRLQEKLLATLEQTMYRQNSYAGVIVIENCYYERFRIIEEIKKNVNMMQSMVLNESKEALCIDAKEMTAFRNFRYLVYKNIVHKENIDLVMLNNVSAQLVDSDYKMQEFKKLLEDIRYLAKAPIIICGDSLLEDVLIQKNYMASRYAFV